MSQLKLTADGGGGTVAIKGPASTTGNAAIELIAPGSSNGTIITTGSHKPIVNYVQTVKTDVFSEASITQGSQTSDAIFLDYAANSSSNKLLINYSLSAGSSTANRVSCMLAIGGTIQSSFIADAASNRKQVMSSSGVHASWRMCNLAGSALISSPSTSSTRYSFKLAHGGGGTYTMYLNRGHEDNDASYQHRGVSMITIMEIAA